MVTPTPTTVQVQIQLRGDTAANWSSVNPVLLNNELGLETDTKKIKVGNGSTAWNSLAYFPFVVSGGTVTGNLEIGTTGTLTFEGSTADGFETTLGVVNPTADRTINLPNVSGTIITTGDTGTVTSTMIADGAIVNADVSASAAIAHSKLATITAGYVLIGNASNVPTATQVTGDVTISNTGVTAISSGVIVDNDISASAEIAVSKLADGAARQLLQTDAAGTGVEWTDNVDVPGTLDVTGAATFDSSVTIAGDLTVNGTTTNINTQNLVVEDKNIILADVTTPTDLTADGGGITLKGASDKTITWSDTTDSWEFNQPTITTGSSTAASFIPTSSTVPSNGVYLSGTNTVAVATNSTGRLFVDASGRVGVGAGSPSTSLEIASNATSQTVGTIPTVRLTNTDATAVSTDITGSYEFYSVDLSDPNIVTGFIRNVATSAGVSYDLTFGTKAVGVGVNAQERLRITSDGKLGLGLSSPAARFHLRYDAPAGENYRTRSIVQSNDARLILGAYWEPGVNSYSYIQATNDAETSTIEKLLLNPSGGNVGIGTTAPTAALAFGNVVDTNGYDVSRIRLYDNLSGAIAGFGVSASQLNYRTLGAHVWYDGTSERARIDSSGRLLVGTSTSTHNISNQSKLAIVVTGYLNRGGLDITGYTGGGSTGASAEINLNRSVDTTDGSVTGLSAFPWSLGTIRFNGANGSGFGTGAEIRGIADSSVYTTSNSPAYLSFATTPVGASSPMERMKISSGGNVGITGNQAGVEKLYVQNYAGTTTDKCIFTDLASGSNNANAYHVLSITQGVGGWGLTGNGTSTFSSDERKKKNIETTRDGYLEDLCKLRVVKYNWKAEEDGTPKELGLIAQEVEQVFPGLITEGIRLDGDDFDIKSIKGSVIPFMLLKALQEAAAKIETLEAKVNALEGN